MPIGLLQTKGVLSLAFLCIAWFLYSKFSHILRARRLGCRPAYVRPYRLPFGIDIAKRYARQAEKNASQTDDVVLYEELASRSTWYQNLLGYWHHVTVDPQNIRAVLATQFQDFSLGPIRSGSFAPFIGHGIFTSDGKDWERSRALLRPQFTRGQISNLELIETHVQHLFNRLEIVSDFWTSQTDLAPLFFNLTLDSATEFLFGHSALSQEPNKGGATTALDWSGFGQRFDAANAAVNARGRLMDLYFLYNPKTFKEDCREVHRYVDDVVERSLSKIKDNEEKDRQNTNYVFLDELIKSTHDTVELRSQLLNILLAGRDTTAGLLSWTFYYLARNQAVYEKLRGAVTEAFGNTPDSITFETLKSCNYLQLVMREILRLEPIVPENSRRAVKNTTLPRGGGVDGQSPVYIRAGEEVAYNVFVLHRRKDIWGEDADEFRPERWIDRKTGWEYLPFNGGPRICLGQQFALTEAGYVIVRMMQRFDRIELFNETEVTRRRFTATTSPVEVLVRLHEAQ